MDIFLVRHGEAAAAWGQDPDPGLSALGGRQAVAAADNLLPRLAANVKLVSSPLKRAQETASPLSASLGLPVSINEAFCEIPAPVPLADRQTWLRSFMAQRWSEQPAEILQWRDAAMEQLLSLAAPTVIFSHFLVLNAVVGTISGHADTLYFWPDNASITHLKMRSDGTLALAELGEQMETVVN